MEKASADDRARLAELADRGEIAGPVTHEFNNVLNTVVLQLAIIEPEMSPEARADLAVIRKQAEALTELVRQFQRYRKREPSSRCSTNLNEVIRSAGEILTLREPGFQDSLTIELEPGLPEIEARFSDIERLCRFLLENAFAAAARQAHSITVRTSLGIKGKVTLQIDDCGPCIDARSLDSAFELAMTPRAGTQRLELAACKSIVRRSDGEIRAANRPEGGVSVFVEWQGLNGGSDCPQGLTPHA
jgi:C4-dicarboxylate-specific signal transduction histidine kinase